MRTLHGLSLKSAADQLGITRPKLVKLLRNTGYLSSHNLPYREHIQQGLFVVETRSFRNLHNIEKQYAVVLITGIGLAEITSLIRRQNVA